MRTGTMKWSLAMTALLVTAAFGCGDDTSTGGAGGGTGGASAGGGGQGTGAGTTTTGGGGQTSTGGSGGVGGTGGVGPSGETCADAIPVALGGTPVSMGGEITANTSGDILTFCVEPEGSGNQFPELVYEVTTTSECILNVALSSQFDGAISFRSLGCETDDYCLDGSAGNESFSVYQPEGTYHVVITSKDGPGTYDVTFTCAAPACGDTFKTGMEECDDGNTTSGDGCGATCLLEGTEQALTCAGAEAGAGIPIAQNQVLHLPGGAPYPSTVNAQDNGTGSCMYTPDGSIGEFPAADEVYRIIPSASGMLTATIGRDENDVAFCGADEANPPPFPYPAGCYWRAIHARSGDCDAGTEVACSDTYGPQGPLDGNFWDVEEISFPVTAGQSYYIFADGWLGGVDYYELGQYVLRVELTP